MPDEPSQPTDAAPITASETVESAPAGFRFPDIADVLGGNEDAQPAALSDESPDDDDDADESASEESAEQSASKPDDAPAGDAKPLSRREQRELERKQEIEAARTEAQAAREEHEKTKAELAKERADALAVLGSDVEFEALQAKRLDPDYTTSFDEDERWRELVKERKSAATWLGMAKNAIREQDKAALTALAKELDLKPEQLVGVDPAVAIRNAVTATEARVRSETADRIKELEADQTSLATNLAGKSKSIGPGGQSDAGSRRVGVAWDTNRPASDNLLDALKAEPAGVGG